MGHRLKLIRKALGLTQEQLAQRLGVGKTALSMVETGKARLSNRNKNILVQEFNISPEWLDNETGEMFNADPSLVKAFCLKTDNSLPMQSVPLYSIEGTAGLVPLFTNRENFEPVNFIHIPNLPKRHHGSIERKTHPCFLRGGQCRTRFGGYGRTSYDQRALYRMDLSGNRTWYSVCPSGPG